MDELQQIIDEIISCEECRAEPAVRQISAFGEQAIQPLKELLDSANTDVRWWVTWALSEIHHPSSRELLVRSLNDPEPKVRQAAALALRQQPDPAAIPALISALDSEDEVMVRLASTALVALDGQAVPALLEALDTGSRRVRLEVVRSLALIGDQRAIPALFEALQNDSALMEFWASEGLERMGVGMQFFKP